MVHRIYVEKQPQFAQEAAATLADIRNILGISHITGLRILNRYDVEGTSDALFASCRYTVFAEPQTDLVYDELPQDADAMFAVEYLPGQFPRAGNDERLLLTDVRPDALHQRKQVGQSFPSAGL